MSVELLVAWRHLRDADKRARWTLLSGVALVLLAVVAWIVAAKLGAISRPYEVLPVHRYWRLAGPIKIAAMIVGALGLVCVALGALFRTFTAFTAFSIFGVFLGTFAPILALSVMSGFEADLKSKIRGAKADVVVSTANDAPFKDYAEVRRKLLAIPGVAGATPFIEAEVMMRAGQTPAGVTMRGIDPQTATEVLDLGRTLREGSLDLLEDPSKIRRSGARALWPVDRGAPAREDEPVAEPGAKPAADEPAPPLLPAVILGEELYARILRVFVGDEVRITCPLCGISPSGPIPKDRAFRVAGHFYSGMYEFDSKLAYMSLAAAQKFLNMPGEVTGVDVRTTSPEQARAVADAAGALLGKGYEVLAWEDLNKALFLALKVEKIVMFVVLTLIALVASFSIVSNLFMLVTEKAREVAILKTMGARDGSILRVFLLEGLTIGALGLVTGTTAGVGACLALSRFGLRLPSEIYYIEKLPVVMRPAEIVIISLVALALSCLAAVYPALLASRLRPVEGLRYE